MLLRGNDDAGMGTLKTHPALMQGAVIGYVESEQGSLWESDAITR
jgi:hypothetical protein